MTGRMIRFVLGLVIAAGAMVAAFVFLRISNPAPIGVLIAARDIQPFEVLKQEDVRVDWQRIHPSVARQLLTKDDADILGQAVVVETLYAGEPVAKARLAIGRDAQSARRISTAIQQGWVVVTVPADPNRAPDPGLYPGDAVILVATFAGGQIPDKISQQTQEPAWGYSSGGMVFVPGATREMATPTPQPFQLRLPATKAIGPAVVVRLKREMIPTTTSFSAGEAQTAYIEGDLTHLILLVPQDRVEQLMFALQNGKVSVAVLPALAREWAEAGEDVFTMGYTWDDFNAQFLAARGVTTTAMLDPDFGVIVPTPMPTPTPGEGAGGQ